MRFEISSQFKSPTTLLQKGGLVWRRTAPICPARCFDHAQHKHLMHSNRSILSRPVHVMDILVQEYPAQMVVA
jgi:hypothetical protein